MHLPRILCLALMLGAAPALADQPDYDERGVPEGSIATSLPAGGDPFGHRAALAERGVTFNLWYRNDVLSNLSGGQRRGTVDQGMLETSLAADLEKLAGLTGLRFYGNAFVLHNTGRMRRDYVGGVNTIAAIEGVPTARLSEFWLEQGLAGGTVRLRAGQLAADVEFFFSEASALFLQSDFPTIAALNLPSGGPAYPLATPGVMVAWDVAEDTTLKLAVFNGDPAGRGEGDEQQRNRHGTNFRTRDPALIFAEAQFRANQGEEGLARTAKLGGWAHPGGFDDQRVAEGGDPRRRRGQGGVYGVLDQQLWRPAGGDAGSGVTGFLRAAASPGERSVIGFQADGGVVAAGLVPGRPEDRLGISLLYARFSDAVRDQDREARRLGGTEGVRGHEMNLEATWQAEVVPGFSLQPMVARVWHPGGVPGRNAVVAGLRTQLRF
ncbi:carbohydrate porin [Falsiroseomonas ponticola]|uniref:carbohydrate porin n=1 Tax=Falsiroseomonas ponticola TaxID=2786951 RepID=UPI0019322189|nr:carbohydrate porin [Roseomonas ponticola]